MYQTVRFEVDDGVAVVTLQRPERLNAFSGAMGEELADAYRRCDAEDAIRAVVLTGAGRAFCAGADMSEAARTFQAADPRSFSAAAVAFPAFRVRKLVIAAVNGHAIGVGMTLAMQCDLRFFAREGRYGIVQVRRGAMPDAYAHWTVLRAVGLARAAELLLTGRTYTGEEIDCLGVATRVLPAEDVLPVARALARDVAANAAPLSVAVSKRLLWEAALLSPEQVERVETALHLHLFGRSDAVERSARLHGETARALAGERQSRLAGVARILNRGRRQTHRQRALQPAVGWFAPAAAEPRGESRAGRAPRSVALQRGGWRTPCARARSAVRFHSPAVRGTRRN